MKKYVKWALTFTFLIALGNAFAQKNEKDSVRKAHKEELVKLRKELYTAKLSLTPEEAIKFFPIMEKYQEQKRAIGKEYKKKWKEKEIETMTEIEAEEYLADMIALREKQMALFKEYMQNLKGVLPAKKRVKLNKVEREVNKELIAKAKGWKGKKKGKMHHSQE